MHHAFLYISLPSLHDYNVKVPNFTFCQGREHKTGGYFHTLPIRVCAAQRGHDFEAPDLERVFISEAFSRTHESSSFVSMQPFEIIQGQIAFKNTVQCVNKQTCCTLVAPCVLACRVGVFSISRMGYGGKF